MRKNYYTLSIAYIYPKLVDFLLLELYCNKVFIYAIRGV